MNEQIVGQGGEYQPQASSSINSNNYQYQQQGGYGNPVSQPNPQPNQHNIQNADPRVQQQGVYNGNGQQQQQQQQQQQITLQRTPATAAMGFPGSIRKVHNPKTGLIEYRQTVMIVTELHKNQWGFGINLNDNDGVVRIQAKRPNPDKTPSPVQQNPNIHENDVIYKVQNAVLGVSSPLNLAVTTMQNNSVVQLTLLRHVPISAAEANAILKTNPPEPQVYCEMHSEQLHQLQYQILVLRLLQSKRMPDQNTLANALGIVNRDYAPRAPKPRLAAPKKSKKKRSHNDSDSDDDSDYDTAYPFEELTPGVERQPPRWSLRKKAKKSYNLQDADLEREDEKYRQQMKEANEEMKDEAEVMKKIELIVGGRYRNRPDTGVEELELLIKWTNHSYYHLDWIFQTEFTELGQGAIFRCRHFLSKNAHRIEHYGPNDTLPGDSEYYDPEYATIDRVLYIRDSKNTAGHSTAEFEDKPLQEKVQLTLESPLLSSFYTPWKIYLLQKYIKGMAIVAKCRKDLESSSTENTSESPEMKQIDELEKQYEKLLPPLVPIPAVQKLVLVKWNNQTYDQLTWELESDVHHEQSKIIAFHRNNRLPDMNSLAPFMGKNRPSMSQYKQYQKVELKNNITLREYQVEGVNWLIFSWYMGRNCILADEMGLGKTLQSIALLNHFFTKEHIRGPFLVLAPLSTLGHWKREIETATDLNVVQYHSPHGGEESRERIRQYEFQYPNCTDKNMYKFNVLLTTYNILMSDLDVLQDIHWRYMIIDEAQRAKSQNTKLFSALKQINTDAKLLLTGTPLQNNMSELWSLLNFIEPSQFASETDFISKFGNLTDADQVGELHKLLQPFFLRRVKSDVEKNIPPKIETVIDIELTSIQKRYYRAIYDRNRAYLEYDGSSMAQLVSIVTELRKCCNHPFMIRGVIEKETHENRILYNQLLVESSGKFLLLSKLLPKLYEEKHQVLIFSQFISTLNLLEDLLALLGYTFDRLDGGVRGDLRQQRIDKFNSGKVFAFLLSTKAGGLGLNLTAADTVIIFDNDWNPQNDVQAEARAHRIGQQKEVHVYRLVTKGTYEQELFSRASRKLGLSQAVFDSGFQSHFRGPAFENTSDLLEMDVKKIEQLLKFGAFAFADTSESETTIESTTDINEFMKKNSYTYVIKETPEGEERKIIDGEEPHPMDDKQFRFNQAHFVSKDSNKEVDFKDPQFWDKVLGPRIGERLLRSLETVLNSHNIKEIADYVQDLSNLVVEVVNEKMSGNIHCDYNTLLDILHTLSMSEFYFGSLDMGELAGRWKEIIELKGRQLRRKKMAQKEVNEEGLIVHIVQFSDTDQGSYKTHYDESETESVNRKPVKRQRKEKAEADPEKPRKRRKKEAEPTTDCKLLIRLQRHVCDDNEVLYRFDQVIQMKALDTQEKPMDIEKERTRKPKKNRTEVYFDMTNEISKASYENYQATCHSMKKDQWYCCVCFGDDNSTQNPLFQCSKCGCIVHKYCYGIDQNVDNGDWLCDYCQYVKDQDLPWNGQSLSCPLCYYTGGAYKQTERGRWVHALCAVWASEIRFGDEAHMRNLSGIETIPDNIFRYKCYLCHKNGFYSIKCMSSVCSKHFHPLCGRRNGLRMELVPDKGLQAFCDKHGKKKRVRIPRKQGTVVVSDQDSYQEE